MRSAANRIIVIGTSAGGVDALTRVVQDLPADLPAAVCVVLHIPPGTPSLLTQILSRRTALNVHDVRSQEPLQAGTIYVAPPDRHIIIGRGRTIEAISSPHENRHRPAVDPLFRSAALEYGAQAIGVILTGALDDGTAGLVTLKARGGIAVIQDPHDALFPSMPESALQHVAADHVLPLDRIGSTLDQIARQPAPHHTHEANSALLEYERRISQMDPKVMHDHERPGSPSPYSCPDCGGVLFEIAESGFTRFRCRVGHAFSPDTMLSAHDEQLESALWAALKTLEENAALAHRLADAQRGLGHEWIVKRFEERERMSLQRAEVIRRVLSRNDADRGADNAEMMGQTARHKA